MERVRGDARHAEHDADVLQPAIGIEQFRTDGADMRVLRVLEHRRSATRAR